MYLATDKKAVPSSLILADLVTIYPFEFSWFLVGQAVIRCDQIAALCVALWHPHDHAV